LIIFSCCKEHSYPSHEAGTGSLPLGPQPFFKKKIKLINYFCVVQNACKMLKFLKINFSKSNIMKG
jgi:hypothetical protein